MLSIASTSTHIVAVILLAGFLPGAKADCWVDEYVYQKPHIRGLIRAQLNCLIFLLLLPLNDLRNTNEETCDGLSNVARALIGLAFCTYHHPNDPHHVSQISPVLYLH
jgi:hypothetical protein